MKVKRYWFLLLLFFLPSCAGKVYKKPRVGYLNPASYKDLSGWHNDNHLQALETFKVSCRAIAKYNHSRKISTLTDLGGRVEDWIPACKEATNDSIFTNMEARTFFEKWFIPYEIRDHKQNTNGKYTGYFELELKGSLKRSKVYKYPIYRRPPNLNSIKGKEIISHASINNGSLENKNLEIAWVEDKARLFFMHIQGSGVVKLKEGGEIKLGYDGQNGFGYTHIGPLFKEYTKDRIGSPIDMMRWLHRNPKVGKQIMERNKSYIFFKEIKGDGPIGAQGIPIAPERSVAIDSGLYPYGTPFWIQTHTPKIPGHEKNHYNKLFIAQDTGGAIKGAIRGDIFYGRGHLAEQKASFMNNAGSCFALFPKTVAVPPRYQSK
jgi:membrane-bound lytic murein transglycosylase A